MIPLAQSGREIVAHPAIQSGAKRALDLSIALIAFLFLLPLLTGLSIAILLETGRPVFFRQPRGGVGGETFNIFKFRTMYVRPTEPDDEIQPAGANDPRVTPLGDFLRRSSLDELPQLFNVIRGEMSVVGPRPHAVVHEFQFRRRFADYDLRNVVRPGMTGLAQIHGLRGGGHDDASLRARFARDREYVRNWSLQLDLQILVRTALLVMTNRLGERPRADAATISVRELPGSSAALECTSDIGHATDEQRRSAF